MRNANHGVSNIQHHPENDHFLENESADLSDILAHLVPEAKADSHADAVEYAHQQICELMPDQAELLAAYVITYGWPSKVDFKEFYILTYYEEEGRDMPKIFSVKDSGC